MDRDAYHHMSSVFLNKTMQRQSNNDARVHYAN